MTHPPHIRTPEAWLERAAAPLLPEVRGAVSAPYRQQLEQWHTQGMAYGGIIEMWEGPLGLANQLQEEWPTVAQQTALTSAHLPQLLRRYSLHYLAPPDGSVTDSHEGTAKGPQKIS